MKLILTVGISNSGKTTWANKFVENNPMTANINRDDLRITLFCKGNEDLYHKYRFSKGNEELVTELALSIARNAVRNGKDIIISDTNLNGKTREFWGAFAKEHKLELELKVFDEPLHICMGRNRKRRLTMPDRVLIQQYNSFRKFMKLPTYTGTEGKPAAIIVDVDGTVADMTGVRKPFEWEKVINDKPKFNVIAAVNALKGMGYKVVIMSGRDGVCMADTKQWLRSSGVPYDDIFMRESGNNQPDSVVKEKMFWDNVADNYDVRFSIDDRDQMVHHWRAMGIECWQVGYGDF